MSELEFNYSSELDILSVDDVSKKYSRSVRSGNFIIDLNSDGEVRGVEIQNVSRILGMDREELSDVSEVVLEGDEGSEGLTVVLRLRIDESLNTLAAQVEQVSA